MRGRGGDGLRRAGLRAQAGADDARARRDAWSERSTCRPSRRPRQSGRATRDARRLRGAARAGPRSPSLPRIRLAPPTTTGDREWLAAIAACGNDLEAPAIGSRRRSKRRGSAEPAARLRAARMTGSGATVVGLFSEDAAAAAASIVAAHPRGGYGKLVAREESLIRNLSATLCSLEPSDRQTRQPRAPPCSGDRRDESETSAFQPASDRPRMRIAAWSQRIDGPESRLFRKSSVLAGAAYFAGAGAGPRPEAPFDAGMVDAEPRAHEEDHGEHREQQRRGRRAVRRPAAQDSGERRQRQADIIGPALQQAELAWLQAEDELREPGAADAREPRGRGPRPARVGAATKGGKRRVMRPLRTDT